MGADEGLDLGQFIRQDGATFFALEQVGEVRRQGRNRLDTGLLHGFGELDRVRGTQGDHGYGQAAAALARGAHADGGVRVQQLAGRKWTSIDWRQIAGAAAVESVGAIAGGNALRQLTLLKERRFVSLAFLGTAAAATGVEAERFFKSLKLA